MTVTLQHSGPVELGALSASLQSLSAQHGRYADRVGAAVKGERVRLYVREIRSGSIIVDLVAMAQQPGLALAGVNTVFAFAKNIGSLLRFGMGQDQAPPAETSTRDAKDVAQLIEPVATDARASLTIEAKDHSTVNVTQVFVDSNGANMAQNRLGKWVAQQVEPVTGIHRQQLFYFERATRDAAGQTGDKGFVETITRQAVKTIFATPEIKEQMLHEALLRRLYVVDVEVQTVEDVPRLYRILFVHESMDQED